MSGTTFPSTPTAGQTVIAPAGGAFTWNGRGWTSSFFPISPNTRASVAGSAIRARTANPRTLAAMTTPPAITDNAAATGALSNIYSITGATSGVLNQFGGVPTDDGLGFNKYPSVTQSGTRITFVSRVEIVADAAIVEFAVFNQGGVVRFIVDGQYVSKTVTTPVPAAGRWLKLDFTSAGGRARRNITLEMNKAVDFKSVAVGPTETVTKAPGKPVRLYVVGDSLTQGVGATIDFNTWCHVLADYLGIRDIWNGGIGGTGFLNNFSGTQLTFRQRLSDMVIAAPDIVLIAGGVNDIAFTPAAMGAEVTAYMTAIRAATGLAAIPVIITTDWTTTPAATANALETAMANAVATFGDPLMFFLPNTTSPEGPMFTGTGYAGAPTGSGNCDVYIYSDGIHPNDAGHTYMAGWYADALMRRVFL